MPPPPGATDESEDDDESSDELLDELDSSEPPAAQNLDMIIVLLYQLLLTLEVVMPYGYYGRCYGCDLLPPPIEWNIVEWIVIVDSGWAGGGVGEAL